MPIRISKNRVSLQNIPLNLAAEVDVASATTTNIGAALSNNIRITGTTTITSLGTAEAGLTRNLRFAGALTITHNVTSLILPEGANIITVANDTTEFLSLGSGNWFCREYTRHGGGNLSSITTNGSGDISGYTLDGTSYIITYDGSSRVSTIVGGGKTQTVSYDGSGDVSGIVVT